MAVKKGSKNTNKATYEGYATFDVDATTVNIAFGLMDKDFNLWGWMDSMQGKGYEFQFESNPAEGYCQLTMMQRDKERVDAGLFLYTSALNTIEALVLTWYKFEQMGGGLPLIKATPKGSRIYR